MNPIIPQPVSVKEKPGCFTFPEDATIAVASGCEQIARQLRQLLAPAYGLDLAAGDAENATVVLSLTGEDLGAEGYRLSIAEKKIRASASTPAGLFYATQTLRQLLPVEVERNLRLDEPPTLPVVEIEDTPRFPWRGMHLDVCRHFFSVDFLKRYLDLMALHKYNLFHWHLTEDQGWRIEVPAYPELTEVSAWRTEADGSRYGGFYTRDQIREVVAYASERHITVLPEIEMPGHAQAALAAYPELSCSGGPFEVWTEWGVSKEVYCAGNDDTFAFLEKVLDQVIELFPGEYVHIGGDECPKDRWKECPQCQQRIKEEGLADEHELQSYFIKRMAKFLAERGKKLIGWDEILEGGLASEAAVMSWRGTEGGIAASRAGNDVVMTPHTHVYFDYKHYEGEAEPGWLGVTPLERTYAYEPLPEKLTEEQGKFVLGAQGNVWSEKMETEGDVEVRVFPRMCALAEGLWSPLDVRDWENFKERLRGHARRLDALDVRYYRDRAVWTQIPVAASWSFDDPVAEEVVRSARLLRERFLADPHRPGYHYCVPEDMGMPGDPNGAFYHDGRYHLMYLYNRSGSGFCWGHISSVDLVHWRHHPDAIGPGGGDEGCFSGGGFVDEDGTAYLSYWMLWGDRGIGLARSTDADFDTWAKLEANPVIRSTEWGVTEVKDADGQTFFYGSADPSNVWKKDGRYYMLTGNLLVLNKIGREEEAPLAEQGDRLYLFVSDDLERWEYLHVFYERRPEWTDRSEDNMCPSFLPLPSSPTGGPMSDKHLLLFISHNMGCQYYVGDYREDRFYPDNHGRMSWVDNTYFAPEALIDGRGRQIMWSWLTDNPPDEKENGWSGVYGLPRSLWLGEDGTLRMRPVEELEMLRSHETVREEISLGDGETRSLENVTGDSCELRVEIDTGDAQRCGLKVRASEDGEEETLLYWDRQAGELVFDATKSGEKGRPVVERAPFALEPGAKLELHVFVDKSVVEIFANDRQAIGRRVYPSRGDSLGIALIAAGGEARFEKVTAWRIEPSNPY